MKRMNIASLSLSLVSFVAIFAVTTASTTEGAADPLPPTLPPAQDEKEAVGK
jgi:hypothetical protein